MRRLVARTSRKITGSSLAFVAGVAIASAIGCATGTEQGFVPGGEGFPDASVGETDGATRDSHLIFEVEADSGNPGDSRIDSSSKSDDGTKGDAPDTGCPLGSTKCAGGCYDLTKDPTHCGACDKGCAAGEVCGAGTCGTVCGGGTTLCGGLCVDLTKDAAHCGSCAKACATGETCSAGACALVCGGGTTKCGASCINTTNDSANCGACGKVCPGGAAASCSAGSCGVTCSGSFANCNGSAADGCEANLDSDPANCGACGTACGACTTCTARTCSPSVTPFVFPSTGSSTKAGALGAGGGGRFYQAGDFVQQTFSRGICATSIDLDFTMSDFTDGCWCFVGTLHWNVIVNGTAVGSYSFAGGSSCGAGTSIAIKGTIPFSAAIAPIAGAFTVRLEATDTVCGGGSSWNWVAGGTIKLK